MTFNLEKSTNVEINNMYERGVRWAVQHLKVDTKNAVLVLAKLKEMENLIVT